MLIPWEININNNINPVTTSSININNINTNGVTYIEDMKIKNLIE